MTRLKLAAVLTMLAVPITAYSQPIVSTPNNATTAASPSNYWTPNMMQSAQPRTPTVSSNHTAPTASTPRATPSDGTGSAKESGSPPTVPASEMVPVKHGTSLTPGQMQADYPAEDGPAANSQYGLPFTTSEVEPAATRISYPYITTGKLYFTDPGVGNFVCSASVLRIGLVVTAGHCVYQPQTATKTAHFYSNFMFVPAYDNKVEPAGRWFPIQEGTTGEWAGGGDTVPNAQDVGMMVMYTNNGYKIGQITGYLGYYTNQLSGNNVTMLGYPCNLDNCEVMIRTDAGNSISGGNNTYEYGSASAGGASGGPWVQDFGSNPVSTGGKTWYLGNNYLVSVTSYQPSDGLGGYLGGSDLNGSFLDLMSKICNANPGNC